MMKTNLRGELTLYNDDKMQQFSLRDNELIDAVASHFKVGSTEVFSDFNKIDLKSIVKIYDVLRVERTVRACDELVLNSKDELSLLILIKYTSFNISLEN